MKGGRATAAVNDTIAAHSKLMRLLHLEPVDATLSMAESSRSSDDAGSTSSSANASPISDALVDNARTAKQSQRAGNLATKFENAAYVNIEFEMC